MMTLEWKKSCCLNYWRTQVTCLNYVGGECPGYIWVPFFSTANRGKPILHVTWYITMLCCACKQSPVPTASTCMCVLRAMASGKVARPSAICTHALLCQCYRLMMMTRARDCPTERGLPNRLMRFIHGTTRSRQAGKSRSRHSCRIMIIAWCFPGI